MKQLSGLVGVRADGIRCGVGPVRHAGEGGPESVVQFPLKPHLLGCRRFGRGGPRGPDLLAERGRVERQRERRGDHIQGASVGLVQPGVTAAQPDQQRALGVAAVRQRQLHRGRSVGDAGVDGRCGARVVSQPEPR